MTKTSTIVAAVGTLATISLVGYLFYFDHKRRTDPNFHSKLRKSARKHEKLQQAKSAAKEKDIVKYIKKSIAENPLYTSLENREKYFLEEVSKAEEFSALGESGYLDAAEAYYRAFAVYPSPQDLLGVYAQSVKQPIFEILLTMIKALPPANLIVSFRDTGIAPFSVSEPETE